LNKLFRSRPRVLEPIHTAILAAGDASSISPKNAKSNQYESCIIHFGSFPQPCQWHKTQRASRRHYAHDLIAIGVGLADEAS
jgi:hypothetical protein